MLCPIAVKDAYLVSASILFCFSTFYLASIPGFKVYVVKNYCERNENSSVIVFAQTCRECQALSYMFEALGFKVSHHRLLMQVSSRLTKMGAILKREDGNGDRRPTFALLHDIQRACPKTFG